MKILIAPLHYMANKIDGSEYSRAYDYLNALSKIEGMSGDVIVGFMKESRLGNFRIHSLLKRKPSHISIPLRLYFITAVFMKSLSLIASRSYDLIWHNGPFALGETFSLLCMWNNKKIPFLLGPVVTPHTFVGIDEAHSMGSKLSQLNILDKFKQTIHYFTYKLAVIFKSISNHTLLRSSYILAKDSVGLRMIRQLGHSNSQVMLLPTDLSKFYSSPRKHLGKKYNLLSVGYLVTRKNTQLLVKAIYEVVAKYHRMNFVLTIVGDGPDMQAVKNLVYSLKMENYVRLVGYVPKAQIAKHYRQADIFVSASVSESLPAMYYEAMASSLPIIMVENSSSTDLNKIYFGGLIARPNDVRDLANKINQLLSKPRSIRSLGGRNYKLAKNILNLDNQITNLVNIMKKVSNL